MYIWKRLKLYLIPGGSFNFQFFTSAQLFYVFQSAKGHPPDIMNPNMVRQASIVTMFTPSNTSRNILNQKLKFYRSRQKVKRKREK